MSALEKSSNNGASAWDSIKYLKGRHRFLSSTAISDKLFPRLHLHSFVVFEKAIPFIYPDDNTITYSVDYSPYWYIQCSSYLPPTPAARRWWPAIADWTLTSTSPTSRQVLSPIIPSWGFYIICRDEKRDGEPCWMSFLQGSRSVVPVIPRVKRHW